MLGVTVSSCDVEEVDGVDVVTKVLSKLVGIEGYSLLRNCVCVW